MKWHNHRHTIGVKNAINLLCEFKLTGINLVGLFILCPEHKFPSVFALIFLTNIFFRTTKLKLGHVKWDLVGKRATMKLNPL